MKIRNFINVACISLTHLFSFCGLNAIEQRVDTLREAVVEKLVTRAAIDLGSSQVRCTVADIDPVTNQISKICHESFIKVELRKDLAMSSDGCLSQKIEQELIAILNEVQQQANSYSPQEWAGIGTSVFRTAKNGQEFLDRVNAATGLDIHIIPQSQEAEIGFATAVAASHNLPKNTISWDLGAGSFQISTLIDGKIEMYGAEFSQVATLEALFANREQAFDVKVSPNPVSVDEAIELIETVRSKLPPIPSWIVQNRKHVVILGSEGMEATGHSPYTKADLLKALLSNCGKSDEQLNHLPDPKKAIIAQILMYALMEHCDFEVVGYFHTNGSCEGLLTTSSLWNL